MDNKYFVSLTIELCNTKGSLGLDRLFKLFFFYCPYSDKLTLGFIEIIVTQREKSQSPLLLNKLKGD